MRREDFFKFIEETKMSSNYENENKFVVIDLDIRHAEVFDELPEVISGQWIVVLSKKEGSNIYETVGFFDKSLTRIDYIPLGFWLIKSIKCGLVLRAELRNRFFHSVTDCFDGDDEHFGLMNFSKFLDALWIHEIQTRNIDYNFVKK
jgi:hypothetical protein